MVRSLGGMDDEGMLPGRFRKCRRDLRIERQRVRPCNFVHDAHRKVRMAEHRG